LIEESAVRFGDGYDLNVGAIPEMGEEAVSVTVDQAGDDYAERRFGVGGG
jgi:phage-related protein